MTSRTRIRIRRVVQVACLACFLALLLVLTDAPQAASQLAYRTHFGWAPTFLVCLVDPLAPLAAFAAARALPIFAFVPLAIVGLCLVVPRFFCSHACPLGTIIDLFGALRGGRRERPLRLKAIKYGLLAASAAGAVAGLPLAGHITPLPILTRGLLAAGASGGGGLLSRLTWLVVLLGVLLLSLVRRRFWCNYLCPSGALLSLVSRFARRRQLRSDACTRCGRCVEKCTFAAISPSSLDANADCTYCGECAGVCPVGAITFGRPTQPPPLDVGRREFLASACAAGGLLVLGGVAVAGATRTWHRPPGSLPEDEFAARCIRCGTCARNCPGPAISLVGIGGGLAAWGTPRIVPEVAGCSPTCNNCGRVCPTGAIRRLPLAEKNRISMGTARYLPELCLPIRGEENCTLCHDVCVQAGYSAISLTEQVVYLEEPGGFMVDDHAVMMVPSVLPGKCVGCGLCVMTCVQENVRRRKVLPRPAIEVVPKSPQLRLGGPAEHGRRT